MTCLPEPEPHPTQQSLTQGRGHKHSNIFMRISLGVKYEDCRKPVSLQKLCMNLWDYTKVIQLEAKVFNPLDVFH